MDYSLFYSFVTTLTLVAIMISFVFSVAGFRRSKVKSSCCYLVKQEEEIKKSKPQTLFKSILADNSYNPFQHLNGLGSGMNQQHPYEQEIQCFLQNCEEIQDFSFVNCEIDLEMKGSHVWVDKEHQLLELVDVLSKQNVFAVDTEQHNCRSFLGFTALMQISTLTEDYLVDTIALHDVMGILRPVFANPKICKVFHGADGDVVWLQRDFHIYIVNLFDTVKACDVLLKPRSSLEYLLHTYCGVPTNKELQLSDWRSRPLSAEMIHYARADSHYLIYIADCLAGELKDQNFGRLHHKFKSVRSCMKLYKKEIEHFPGDSAASSILSHYSSGQNEVPLIFKTKDLIRRLCIWRDLMARVHDESLRYVLSDQAIVALAEKAPTIITEAYSVISKACQNLDTPSPIVNSHIEDICNLIAAKIYNPDDFLEMYIRKYLGPNGRCPLSAYNYALLTKSKFEVTRTIGVKRNEDKSLKQLNREFGRQRLLQASVCKAPVYQYKVFRSDGQLLGYCTRADRGWYLHQNLAKFFGKDSLDIMLLCEPEAIQKIGEISNGRNICVCCGANKLHIRYRIMPEIYSQQLPKHLRELRSRNIVIVCFNCCKILNSAKEMRIKEIGVEYKIPFDVNSVDDSKHIDSAKEMHIKEIGVEYKIPFDVNSVDDSEHIEVESTLEVNVVESKVRPCTFRSAARALLRNGQNGQNIPAKRCEELNEIVMNFLGKKNNVSKEELKEELEKSLSSMKNQTQVLGPDPSGRWLHGKQVVDYLFKEKGDDGIVEFRKSWKRLFLNVGKPRYLPSGWDAGL